MAFNRALVLGILAIGGIAFAYAFDVAGFRYYVQTFLNRPKPTTATAKQAITFEPESDDRLSNI